MSKSTPQSNKKNNSKGIRTPNNATVASGLSVDDHEDTLPCYFQNFNQSLSAGHCILPSKVMRSQQVPFGSMVLLSLYESTKQNSVLVTLLMRAILDTEKDSNGMLFSSPSSSSNSSASTYLKGGVFLNKIWSAYSISSPGASLVACIEPKEIMSK